MPYKIKLSKSEDRELANGFPPGLLKEVRYAWLGALCDDLHDENGLDDKQTEMLQHIVIKEKLNFEMYDLDQEDRDGIIYRMGKKLGIPIPHSLLDGITTTRDFLKTVNNYYIETLEETA